VQGLIRAASGHVSRRNGRSASAISLSPWGGARDGTTIPPWGNSVNGFFRLRPREYPTEVDKALRLAMLRRGVLVLPRRTLRISASLR
jgi:hypothetical protein